MKCDQIMKGWKILFFVLACLRLDVRAELPFNLVTKTTTRESVELGCQYHFGAGSREFEPATNDDVIAVIEYLHMEAKTDNFWIKSTYDSSTDIDNAFSWTSETMDTDLWFINRNGRYKEPDSESQHCTILRTKVETMSSVTGKHMVGNKDCGEASAMYLCSDMPPKEELPPNTMTVTTKPPPTTTTTKPPPTTTTTTTTKPPPTTSTTTTTTTTKPPSTITTTTTKPPATTTSTTTANPPPTTTTTTTTTKPPPTTTTTTKLPPTITTTTTTKPLPTITTTTTTIQPPTKTRTTTTNPPPATTITTTTKPPPTITTTITTKPPPATTTTTTTRASTTATTAKSSSSATTATTKHSPSSTTATTTAKRSSSKTTTTTDSPSSNATKPATTTMTATTKPPSSETATSATDSTSLELTTLDIVPVILCPCQCPNNTVQHTNISSKHIQELTNQIHQDLSLDPCSLSLAKRKKISILDNRHTSQSLGVAAILTLTLIYGALVLLDLNRVFIFVVKPPAA